MSKCKWNNGKFKPCDGFNGKISEGFYSTDGYDSPIKAFYKCKQCGADITKPEPIAIIKKSGETWVARYDGFDYLWTGANRSSAPNFFVHNYSHYGMVATWKPISEIEITDSIAVLRPMIMVDNKPEVLYGVVSDSKYPYLVYDGYATQVSKRCKLATVDDLEDE